jgi:hypothetical protein
LLREKQLSTDATGKAKLTFDTPRENYAQDFEYRIEARVTDSSRREIVSTDTVRVTRQRLLRISASSTEHLSTKDKVTVDIKALDAKRTTHNN